MNSRPPQTSSALRYYRLAVAALIVVAATFAASLLHWGLSIEAADTRYAGAGSSAGDCGAQGPTGRHARRSPQGVPYVVVTPRNYRADRAHPLLVVYAPAGLGAGLSERYAGLTRAATSAGFVIAFAGSASTLSLDAVARLARLPDAISAEWCIDATRVVATGHSDGGTVALAMAALPQYRGVVSGIAVSGAGWQAADFAGLNCPPPLPVMILHGSDDRHFPGFGREAAAWFSGCNACSGAAEPDAQGCRRYKACVAETLYCETARSHWRWAGGPQQVADFLSRSSSNRPTPTAPGRRYVAATRADGQ